MAADVSREPVSFALLLVSGKDGGGREKERKGGPHGDAETSAAAT